MKICTYRFVLSFPLLFVLSAFGQNRSFIHITYEGAADNDKVYLTCTKAIRDSAVIKNKQAQFALSEAHGEWNTYFLTYKGSVRRFDACLFLNARTDISLIVEKGFNKFIISGDMEADLQNKFYQGLFPLGEKRKSLEMQLAETTDSANRTLLKNKINSFDQEIRDYCINWVLKYNASPFSVAVTRMFIDNSNILKTLDTVAANCFDKLLPQAKKNNYETYVLQRELAKYSENYSLVPENIMAPPFHIKDTAGNDLSLETFKGKWLLIDFWASWCGPCRLNNPQLKAFSHKYQNKGLEVLSISVDTDSEKWKKAVIQDGMNWYQGSDLAGMDSGAGKMYQLSAVPTFLLISPEGRIVRKSIGGDVRLVEEVLRNIFP